ncbi:hypothetical protein [Lacticaseibacillus sp. GG6-2]
MRVLDLLQLLHDYPKNTQVRIKVADTTQNIATFQETRVNEQLRLVIQPRPAGKPMKCWELLLLLDKPEWRQRFLYTAEPGGVRPLFGFQDQAAKGLILN